MDQQYVRCSQCGVEFPASQIITYENQSVCAGCKPLFVQKLREGVTLTDAKRFAGFWIRFGAKFIDSLLLWAVSWVIAIICFKLFPSPVSTTGEQVVFGTGYFVNLAFSLLIPIFYNTFFLGKYEATLGKKLCGIKVIKADGSKISYGRACGRYFAEFLSSIILCIGYIMAASDPEKRALHDRICNTRVVYK